MDTSIYHSTVVPFYLPRSQTALSRSLALRHQSFTFRARRCLRPKCETKRLRRRQPFYRIRARKRTKCTSVLHCHPGLTGFLLKEDEAKTKCSGIINLLFGVLVDNTCGHFTIATQFVKYPRLQIHFFKMY